VTVAPQKEAGGQTGVTLHGRFGGDPRFAETDDGLVATFLFGVNTVGQKKADWFWVSVQGERAQTVQHAYTSTRPKERMQQGTPVTVVGSLAPPDERTPTRKSTTRDFQATDVTRLARPAAPYKPGELGQMLGA
jgi:hypothetical protein